MAMFGTRMEHRGKIAALSAAVTIVLLYLGLSSWKGLFFWCSRGFGCRSLGNFPSGLTTIFPALLVTSVVFAIITGWIVIGVHD